MTNFTTLNDASIHVLAVSGQRELQPFWYSYQEVGDTSQGQSVHSIVCRTLPQDLSLLGDLDQKEWRGFWSTPKELDYKLMIAKMRLLILVISRMSPTYCDWRFLFSIVICSQYTRTFRMNSISEVFFSLTFLSILVRKRKWVSFWKTPCRILPVRMVERLSTKSLFWLWWRIWTKII